MSVEGADANAKSNEPRCSSTGRGLRTTVSYVLNNGNSGIVISPATRQRVLDAARALGYHPNAAARSLRRQKAGVVGLVTYDTAERLGSFLPLVMDGILSVLGPTGIKLVVEAATAGQPDPCVGLIRGGHVDGLIVTGAQPGNDQLRMLHHDGVPIVLWGRVSGGSCRSLTSTTSPRHARRPSP